MDPHAHASQIPVSILDKFDGLNDDQKNAYTSLLGNLPCGLGILPGGPGGGKTHFAMTTIGLLQSGTKAKTLYLLDINKPLEDTLRKYRAMWKATGVTKTAIRVKTFGVELKNSTKFEEIREASKAAAGITDLEDTEPVVDFSRQFMKYFQNPNIRPANSSTHTKFLSLDEAAWLHYEANPTMYERLTDALQHSLGNPMDTASLKMLVFFLYRKVLREADFVATTPCVAAGSFSTMFSPDLVVLDEAAHARELTSLIPIAFFKNCVWLFIGDFRQTLPFVKNTRMNNRSPQLLVSTMERAHNAGVIHHQLLINHRAFGNLHRLASSLIYDAKMVSGIPEDERFPEATAAVRAYFEKLMGTGEQCVVPRLLVQTDTRTPPTKVNTSWMSVPHTQWTMKRCIDLLDNPKFFNVGDPTKGGTILLLSPYKAAVEHYKKMIALGEQHWPQLDWSRVEARTWDVSQGHEADVVGIDYVRNQVTDFMDGMHRFNVGLTRARQGEWHLMPWRMVKGQRFRQTKNLCRLYDACASKQEGHVIEVKY
jgi:AAA domain-containing protein